MYHKQNIFVLISERFWRKMVQPLRNPNKKEEFVPFLGLGFVLALWCGEKKECLIISYDKKGIKERWKA